MSSDYDSEEEAAANRLNEARGFAPANHPRAPDSFVRSLLNDVEGSRLESLATLKRVRANEYVGSPCTQIRQRAIWDRFEGFRNALRLTRPPNADQVVQFLDLLIKKKGGRGLDTLRKYSTVVSDLRCLLTILPRKCDGFRLSAKDRWVIQQAFHHFWKVERSITKDLFRLKQAVRLTTILYLNEVLVSCCIVNGTSWNVLVRNLALLALLSTLGVRIGELTLNREYFNLHDHLRYTLLWKDIEFLEEDEVFDGYGGMALSATFRIRNGKGNKDDTASDALIDVYSLKPKHFLVDALALVIALGIRIGAIDEQCLQRGSYFVEPEYLEKPVFLKTIQTGHYNSRGFLEGPLTNMAASRIVKQAGLTANLTQPICAHDVRRGFVQDIHSLSDAATAQRATGHEEARTSKIYQHHGRESHMDWPAARLDQGTKEAAPTTRRKRRKDPLLPAPEIRGALTQATQSQLNVQRNKGKKRADLKQDEADALITSLLHESPDVGEDETQDPELDLAMIDPVLRELGAAEGDDNDLDDSSPFKMITDTEPFRSGLWVDFVAMMANRNSLLRAPSAVWMKKNAVTPESREIYRTHQCGQCQFEAHAACEIKAHVDNVHNGVTFSCAECPHVFTSQRGERLHYQEVHKSKLACTECAKVFPTNQKLEKHIARMHTVEKNINCPHCPKKYASEGLLKEHTYYAHFRPRFFCECPGCPRAFSTGNNRDSHQYALHGISNRPILECIKCEFKALYVGELNAHKKRTGH